MVKTSSGKVGMRSFVVIGALKYGTGKTKFRPGRFVSRNPVGAAKKAFNKLCRVKRIVGRCTMVVSVKETTRGSKEKVYHYKLLRKKLAQPRVVKRNNAEFVVEYEVVAKSVDNPKGQVKKNTNFKRRRSRGRMAKKTVKKSRRTINNVKRLFGL